MKGRKGFLIDVSVTWYVRECHRMTVLSAEPLANMGAALDTLSVCTLFVCPANVHRHAPVSIFHT